MVLLKEGLLSCKGIRISCKYAQIVIKIIILQKTVFILLCYRVGTIIISILTMLASLKQVLEVNAFIAFSPIVQNCLLRGSEVSDFLLKMNVCSRFVPGGVGKCTIMEWCKVLSDFSALIQTSDLKCL